MARRTRRGARAYRSSGDALDAREERWRRIDAACRRQPSRLHAIPSDVRRLPERTKDGDADHRQVGVEGDSDRAHSVRKVVEHGVQLRAAARVLCELPWLRTLDKPVELTDRLPDRVDYAAQLPSVEPRRNLRVQRVEAAGDLCRAGTCGQLAVPITSHHRRRPGDEVAELVRELP